jgi:Flp pilus assembly pilin Flp
MRRICSRGARALQRWTGFAERGATAVEYSLILVGIAAVIMAAVVAFGQMVLDLFTAATSAFP